MQYCNDCGELNCCGDCLSFLDDDFHNQEDNYEDEEYDEEDGWLDGFCNYDFDSMDYLD